MRALVLTSKFALGVVVLAGCVVTAQAQVAPPIGPPNPQARPAVDAPLPVDPALQGERAKLGITLSDNTQGRVWVKSVEPGSAADLAGLRPNDQIVSVDEKKIETYLDVIRHVNQKGASEDITITILRHGKPAMLTASLGSEYANPNPAPTYTEFPSAGRQMTNYRAASGTPDAAGQAPPQNPDQWRYRWYNGAWWYYGPNNQWVLAGAR